MNCAKCGAVEDLVFHHISYQPEVTKILCRSCHSKHHRSSKRAILERDGENFKISTHISKLQTIYLPRVLRLILDVNIGDYLEWHLSDEHIIVKKKET